MMRRSVAATLTVFTAACAGGSGSSTGGAPAPAQAPVAATVLQQAASASAQVPATPKDIDPSGTYGVSLVYQGQPITVTLYFGKAEGGGWAGSMSAEGIPTIPLSDVTVKGKTVTASMVSPDGAAVAMGFTIDGADLSGSWKSATDGSAMTGKKLP